MDPGAFELGIGGRVTRPLTLSLTDLRARPSVEVAVTMECAGNGRALLSPRPLSQPWLAEAVGTAAWTGTPSFPERERTNTAGPCEVEGRAWSGWAPVEVVEFSADGGATWRSADRDRTDGPWAWRGWRHVWDATPGEHVLCCRARDAAGNAQPDEAEWNVGGYANNGVQRVPVTVV